MWACESDERDAFDAATTVTANFEQPRGGQQNGENIDTDSVGRAVLAWYTTVALWALWGHLSIGSTWRRTASSSYSTRREAAECPSSTPEGSQDAGVRVKCTYERSAGVLEADAESVVLVHHCTW